MYTPFDPEVFHVGGLWADSDRGPRVWSMDHVQRQLEIAQW